MEYLVLHFQAFLLILVRMNSMFLIAPLYSSEMIPFRLRAGLSFMITIVIFPMVIKKGYALTGNMGEYTLLILNEVIIGVLIGFLASIIFTAFQLSGQFFSAQIGFGMSEVLDPLAQVSIPVIGQLKNMIGILIFLYINGHHFLINAVYRSYELAPFFSISGKSADSILKYLTYSFSGMFLIAFKIALPVVATVFLVSVAMGIVAKSAPQMNIMMLGFPVNICLAFGLLALISPLIIRIMKVSLERSFNFIYQVLNHWPV